jgi:4-carboxymuconolactone decarboxylase
VTSRYERGAAIAAQLSGRPFEGVGGEIAALAPDFARMTIEFPFGDLYSRPAASLRTREIAAVAALAALGTALPQLRVHVGCALNAGVGREELIEILMQTAVYAGFPAALGALAGCHDLLRAEAAPKPE